MSGAREGADCGGTGCTLHPLLGPVDMTYDAVLKRRTWALPCGATPERPAPLKRPPAGGPDGTLVSRRRCEAITHSNHDQPPLPAVGGYLRALRLIIGESAGTGPGGPEDYEPAPEPQLRLRLHPEPPEAA